MVSKLDYDDLELTPSEVARRRQAEVEAWKNREVVHEYPQGLAGVRGRTMFADQHLDSQVLALGSDRSDGYSHTGNSWNQSDVDDAYHRSDPARYPNPRAGRKPQGGGGGRHPFRLNQLSDDEEPSQTYTSGTGGAGLTVPGSGTGSEGKGFGD